MTGSGKPFPGNDRNVFILAKAAPVWGCLGNPLPETVLPVNRPEAIKTPQIPPTTLFLGSSEGLKHAGDAMVSPQTAAAWHMLGSPCTTGQDEGNTGSCSGPGKCLSLCCGFVTVAWKNFSGVFFLLGRRAGGEVLLAGKPTWQGWASPGHRVKQDAPCHPLPLLCFWLHLGTKLRWEAQQQGMGCSALLVYFIMGNLMKEQGMESGVRSTTPHVPWC